MKRSLNLIFLIDLILVQKDKLCNWMYRDWEENHVWNAIIQVWNATPFSKEKTREAPPPATLPLSFLPITPSPPINTAPS